MAVIAAVAKPAAIKNGTATEARATYLRTTAPAAALASRIRPRNTAHLPCWWSGGVEVSGLPQRAEHEADGGRHGQRGHRLILDGLVDRALEVAGHFLHPLASLATLLGHPVGDALGLVG